MQRYSVSSVIMEMQIKNTMRYSTHLLEWLQLKKLTRQCKDVEQQELSFIAGGNTKWHSHFGRQSGSFLQSYIYFYHRIKELHLWVFTQLIWKLICTRQRVTAYSKFIHNNLNLETTKMSPCRWVDKQTWVNPYNGMLFRNMKRCGIRPQYGRILDMYH